MPNGIESNLIESTSAFVGRRLRRFALVAACVNLLLCLLFLFAVTRANSTQICTVVDISIQSYIEPLSREIVIGNREHIATILDILKGSSLLQDVSLSEADKLSSTPQGKQCRLNGVKLEFMTPVTFGQRQVAMLNGSIVWIPVAQILAFLGIAALVSLFFMGIATRFLLRDLHKALITPIGKLARGEVLSGHVLTLDVLKIKRDLDVSRENAKYATVAQLTQMLAHDVRKPFSMIQIVLQNVASARTLGEVKNIVSSSSQEIYRALMSVTGMLADVMEIGQNTTRSRELVSPQSLIYASIRDMGRIFPDSNITFSTSFEHKYLLEIDSIKVQRVFSNIIENAVQAMKGQGRIWFHTTAPDKMGFVELTIGNSDSYIDPDDMQRLFEAFFTKGKKGGTGLGLAIAKKIVTAHDGQIGCRILDKKGVEFWFTLPASEQIDTVNVVLPQSSMEIHESLYSGINKNVDAFSEDVQAETYENEIVQKLNGHRLKVLVLDDEALYRNALIGLLQQLERVSPFIDLLVAASSDEALAHAISKPDIGLFDYDLGESSLNGIETLKAMRQRVPGICICIHSNHIGGIQYKEAVDAGAEHFLPKPISKVHLLRIINKSLSTTPIQMAHLSVPQYLPSKEPIISEPIISALPSWVTRPMNGVVAVLDDCKFTCNAWAQMNVGRPLITFECPEMFWQHVEKRPNFFNSLELIVTDHFFGSASAITGIEFSKMVIGKPVFLASAGDFSHELSLHGIAGVLPRKVMEWKELHAFCASRLETIRKQDCNDQITAIDNVTFANVPNLLDSVSHPDAYSSLGVQKSAQINEKDDFHVNLQVKFLTYAFDIVNEIETVVRQKNLRQVAELAHRLQGCASIVGAYSVENACRELGDGQLSEGEGIDLLRASIRTVEKELRSKGFI